MDDARRTLTARLYCQGMETEHVFAAMPVADRDRAAAWYERLFGRPPDLIPNEHEAAWQLTQTAWVYVFVDAQRAGSGVQTLLIADLDAFIEEVGERGIASSPVEPVGRSGRRTVVGDQDGNLLKVAQVPV